MTACLTQLIRSRPAFLTVVLLVMAARSVPALAQDGVVRMPEFPVSTANVANPSPVGMADTPVSALRFEPRVDVQARNLAENQADISIRGGLFENTGFRLGALALYDPQTGHYLAELPISPAMLGSPRVLTGAANAFSGFGANVGTVAYSWRPIEQRGQLSLAGGDYRYDRLSLYQSVVAQPRGTGPTLGADVEWTRSESDGSRPFGDQNFQRLGGRVQLRSAAWQADLYAGYQHKFFGWPNLYTPFGFNETENLQTVLLAANLRWQEKGRGFAEFGLFSRRNKDDYEFNRAVPGASNPFQHTTWLRGAALNGRWETQALAIDYSLQAAHDNLASTSLTFGSYRERTQAKAALAVEKSIVQGDARWLIRGGGAFDGSTHGGDAGSPLLRVERRDRDGGSIYVEYSGGSQLPTYTALKSNPFAGLFRGNQHLGRERSRNLEIGATTQAYGWAFEAAVFHRQDDALVDWTYRRGVTARTANPVNVGTSGLELLARHHTSATEVIVSCARLSKDADYGSALIDASFYALNFPRDRLTLALIWRMAPGLELRSDNEYRRQEPNSLRVIGGNRAVISTLCLRYAPPEFPGWDIALQADNLWDSDFQEVPAVPSGRRQVALELTRHW